MLLDFIRITNEIISKEIPYVHVVNVNYNYEYGAFVIGIHFFDTNRTMRGLKFWYYRSPESALNFEDKLIIEFTNYLDEHVKPIFKNQQNINIDELSMKDEVCI